MATLDSVKAKIQGLIDKANRTTGNTDTQLSPAVDALIAGYGSGGGGFVDVTELPNISEAEEGVVYRLLQGTEASAQIFVATKDEIEGEIQTAVMSLEAMFAAEGVSANLPVYIVPELPEVMKPMDEATLTIPFYIVESTGIAYLSLDGTNAEVATIGEMFDAPDGNGGWVESADSIPTDNLQLGMNFFCVKKEASVEIKGLYLAVDGEWQSYKEVIDVEELPVSGANQHAIYRVGKTLHRGLYIVDASRDIHDFAEYCEENNMQMGTVEFVSTLPDVAESDKIIYVLNATGELYVRGSDGRPQNVNEHGLFLLFFGGSHGWTEPDAINLFKPGIYTCTGEGFNAKEMCRYVDGAWMIYSIENNFAELVEGKLEHITSKELKQVRIITQGAFSDISSIKSVEIPASVGSIQAMAFKNCYNLETVHFLGDGCGIGRSAFEGCTSLKNINIEDLTGIDTVEYCAFKDCTALESVEIRPSNRYFWEWGNFVFEGCTSLKKVVLDFINSDGDVDPIGTFKNCSSLTEFVLPDEWQYGDLPNEMFRGCKALKDIQLTWGAIGPYAFMESGITNCHFNGTKAQWQQVEKGYWWDRYTPDYVIHCTDGDILKSDPESGSDDRPDTPEPSGMELNIAYGDTAPEDTTKLWVKTSEPSGVVVSPNAEYAEIEGDAVETLADSLPVVRKDVCFSVVGKKAYFFGGTVDSVFSNEILSFDVDNKTFDTLQTTLDSALKNIACAAVGTKIYLFGGQTGSSYNTSQNIIRCFDTETQTMSTCPSTMPKAIANAVCCADGDKIYIFGGLYSWTYTNYDVFCYDVATDVISTVATISRGVLPTQQGVCKYGNYFYFAIGEPRKLARINADSFEEEVLYFQDVPNANSAELMFQAMANVGKYLYVFKYSIKEIWRLDLSSDGNTFERLDVLYDGSETQGNAVTNGEDIYVLGRNTSKFVRYQTIKKFPMVDENSLFVKVSPNATVFPIINTEAAKIEVGIGGAYKGNANGIGEKVEAALYKDNTWTNI